MAAGLFILVWAGFVPLSGAVIVAGSLVVQSSVKKVQHPAGGVVSAIFVHNGSKVKAGDELLRLDKTSAHANLQVIARQLDESRLRIARLNAERDGSEPRWPAEISAELRAAERNRLLASEQDIFAQRATARRGQRELAESRIKQLEKQILGLEAQLASNRRQMTIAAKELQNVEKLLKEKLVTMERLTALQREAARLEGIDGQLSSQIAETHNKINETRLQGIQTDESFRSEVMRDLSEAEAKEGELIERKTAAEDQAKRTIVRAPSTGTIQELTVHTVGGVVSAGEVMMAVVPDDDVLEIDARLSPDKIDQVHVGQIAHVRLTAFNARTTPELSGVVDTISADLVRDPQSGTGYYDIRITLPATEVSRLGKLQLVPGMPAEVFLQTGSRTMLSYLFKPITDQLSRMFRER
jgi:HlyD family secretion protein